MSDPIRLPKQGSRPLPKAIAYPSDYGLAGATYALVRDYGRDGAVNRLIEMADRINDGDDPFRWAFARRRVERT